MKKLRDIEAGRWLEPPPVTFTEHLDYEIFCAEGDIIKDFARQMFGSTNFNERPF